MRIAVISECFLSGGLETRVKGIMKHAINQGHEVHLLTKYFDDKVNLAAGFKGVHIVDFNSIESLKRALTIINPNIADIHPFESLVSGAAACCKLHIPYVVTVHGPYLNQKYLTALNNAACVFAVSDEVESHVLSLTSKAKIALLRNGIDFERFTPVKAGSEKRIAVISRLDPDKIAGIESLLDLLSNEALTIDIIGKGKSENQLKQKYRTVNFIGHIDDTAGHFKINNGMYYMIAGMGRVALEGIAMELPVLLLGYDGVKGFILPENFEQLSVRNFSGRGMTNTYSFDNLQNIFTDYENVKLSVQRLRELAYLSHNEKDIAAQYLEQIVMIGG